MVLPGEGDSTATGHERPTKKKKALHNFRLPNLNWGTQQTLRCMKVEPHGGSGGDEEGIEEFRERMMLDIRTVKESIFREHVLDYKEDDHMSERDELEQPKKERDREVSPTVEVKRWNFRKRRGECEAMELGFVEEKVNTSSSMRSRFISTLSKKEVEDDMMMMTGQLPPRRPKKRPRAVQKKINFLHPAFYFSEEVTEDIY